MIFLLRCEQKIDPEFEEDVNKKIVKSNLCDAGQKRVQKGVYAPEFLQHVDCCNKCLTELRTTEQLVRGSWGM